MKENKETIGYYSVIPATVLYNKELKANEKLLYAIITSLACKEGYCFASNKYLAEKLDVNPKTISSWISDLKNKNFIVVELIRNENNQIVQISGTSLLLSSPQVCSWKKVAAAKCRRFLSNDFKALYGYMFL